MSNFTISTRLLKNMTLNKENNSTSTRQKPLGKLHLRLKVKVQHNLEQSNKKEQLNPIIFAFPTAQIVSEERVPFIRFLHGNHGNEHELIWADIPIYSVLNGDWAGIRFMHYASFVCNDEEEKCKPYLRRRPFYNGILYLSDLIHKTPNETASEFKVELKDSCLIKSPKKMIRDDTTHITLYIKVLTLKFDEHYENKNEIVINLTNDRELSSQLTQSSKLPCSPFNQKHRRTHINLAEKACNKIYDFLYKQQPVLDEIRSMHVPRMPCNMWDILIPSPFFVLDLAENRPQEAFLTAALIIEDVPQKKFVEYAEQQFSNITTDDYYSSFNQVIIIALRTVMLFAHMCQYTADIRYNEKTKKVEDVERFVDVFYTGAGDCECLFKSAVCSFVAWFETELTEEMKKTKPHIYYLIKTLSLFVCSPCQGSAFGDSVDTEIEHTSDVDISKQPKVCHFFGFAIPRVIFARMTNILVLNKSDPLIYPWEKKLINWILESTNDCHPFPRPFHQLLQENSQLKKTTPKTIYTDNTNNEKQNNINNNWLEKETIVISLDQQTSTNVKPVSEKMSPLSNSNENDFSLFSADPETKKQQLRLKQKMELIAQKRSLLRKQFPSLRANLRIPGLSTVDPYESKSSDFYYMITEFWFPYYTLQNSRYDMSFEAFNKRLSVDDYGISARTMVYKPEDVILKPVAIFDEDEIEVALNTLGQQWPVAFPYEAYMLKGDNASSSRPFVAQKGQSINEKRSQQNAKEVTNPARTNSTSISIPTSSSTEMLKPSMELLELLKLSKDFPVSEEQQEKARQLFCSNYIRMFAKDRNCITFDVINDLRIILQQKLFGVFGIVCYVFHFPLAVNPNGEYVELIDIKLYFDSV